MSEWIQENGLSILLSLLGAGGWLGFFLNRYYERKKVRVSRNSETRLRIWKVNSQDSKKLNCPKKV